MTFVKYKIQCSVFTKTELAHQNSDGREVEGELGGGGDPAAGEGDDGCPALEDAVQGASDQTKPSQAALKRKCF